MIAKIFLFCLYLISFSYQQPATVEEYEGWLLMEDFDFYHYHIRNQHKSPELKINVTYVVAAKKRAAEYASKNGKPDRLQLPVDENVHQHPSLDGLVKAKDVMKTWYRGAEKNYDYDHPVISDENISFARIVSKTTQEYGCGQARLREGNQGKIYTVCLYSPVYEKGNERENIERPDASLDPELDI